MFPESKSWFPFHKELQIAGAVDGIIYNMSDCPLGLFISLTS